MRAAVSIPFTVKMRAGWDASLRNALLPFSSREPEPASMLVRVGAGWIDYLIAFLVPYLALMFIVGGEKLLIAPAEDIASEAYVGIVMDRSSQADVIMVSAEGGVDIEEVAATNPEAIHRVSIDPAFGLQPYQARQLAFGLGLDKNNVTVCDVHGVVYRGRAIDMDERKAGYARETEARTLGEVIGDCPPDT